MQLEWRDIPGYEGLYQVSNDGNVRSLNRTVICKNGDVKSLKGRVIAACIDDKGYCRVVLSKKSKTVSRQVHRLVALSFIENPLCKRVVNHIDCNTTNNDLSNLEWATHKENTAHGIMLGRIDTRGEKQSQSKLTKDNVLSIRSDSRTQKAIADTYGISFQHVSDIINRKKWAHV